jgi:toxin ParE1/3/4
MARLIWSEPALSDLEAIADCIALDKPDAAKRYVRKVFAAVEKLTSFPRAGTIPKEIPDLPYRQVVVPPCRILYRLSGEAVFIVHVFRGERLLRPEDIVDVE